MAFCKNCGNKLNESAKFCPKCGAKTTLSESNTEVSSSQSVNNQENDQSNSSCLIKTLKIAGYTILVLFIFGLIGEFLGDDDSQSTSSATRYEFIVKDNRNYQYHFKLMKDKSGTTVITTGTQEAVCYCSWDYIYDFISIEFSQPMPRIVFPNGEEGSSMAYIDKNLNWYYIDGSARDAKDPNRRLKIERIE